jgi:hypothetical protein
MDSVALHGRDSHDNGARADPLKCVVTGCGKEYQSRRALNKHMAKHSDDPPGRPCMARMTGSRIGKNTPGSAAEEDEHDGNNSEEEGKG